MSNRTLLFMTLIVIVGMGLLFVINFTAIVTGQPPNQSRLKFNDVQGMAVQHRDLLYTLNFEQQNQIINILNDSVAVTAIRSGKRTPPDIEKLIIYPLEGKPQIILTPIAYVDSDLIFSAPAWVGNDYLMELSTGSLKNLLSKTYD